jgi:hypothetical protein
MNQFVNNFIGKMNDFSGISAKKIGSLNKTITVIITAGDLAPVGSGTFVIFGNDIYGSAQNAGSASGISISVLESSHSQVKRETSNNPYFIERMLWSTSDNDNLEYNVVYGTREATGYVETNQFQPLNYTEPMQFYARGRNIRVNDFDGLVIDGNHAITGTIKGSSTITMIFNLKAKIDRTNLLNGQNVVDLATPSKPNRIQKVELINSDINPKCNKYNV